MNHEISYGGFASKDIASSVIREGKKILTPHDTHQFYSTSKSFRSLEK